MISLIFALFLVSAPAADHFFERLGTPFMEIIGPQSRFASPAEIKESWLYDLLHLEWFRIDPLGKGKKISDKCSPEKWQAEVLAAPKQFSGWAPLYSKYWSACEQEVKTGRNDIWSNTIEMINYFIDLRNHASARQVVFHLPNDVGLKGLLAMKTDGKKRPLIIFRTGIFSHVTDFMSERPPFMQIFEQSPFNVLVLESMTGLEFLKNNKAFSLGGFDEGLQNFLIAREIQKKDQPLSKYISSVHMMGASMGAHGILYGTLLDELNGRKTVRSTLALCPLLNLKDTFYGHMTEGWKARIINFWTAPRMAAVHQHISDLDDSQIIQQTLAWLEKNYRGPVIGKIPDVILPEGNEDFWSRNDFWSKFAIVKTPVLIFSTENDPIVTWEKNSGLIYNGTFDFPSFQFLKFSNGLHCSLAVSYDWAAVATMMQTFFLKNSPEFKLETRSLNVPGSFVGAREFDLDLDLQPGDTDLTVSIQFADGDPEKIVHIPLKDLEYTELIPVTKSNRSLWLRWANQNIRAVADSRGDIGDFRDGEGGLGGGYSSGSGGITLRWKVTAGTPVVQ
jgi:hypothetical protein